MRIKFLFLCLTCVAATYAQTPEALLADKHITWVAEVEYVYDLDGNHADSLGHWHSMVKFIAPNNFGNQEQQTYYWTRQLLNPCRYAEACQQAFADSALTQPLSPIQAQRRLQLEGSTADNYSWIPLEEITRYKVQMYLYFDQKNQQLKLLPFALAPLRKQYDTEQKSIRYTPLFYLPFPKAPKKIKLNKKRYTWIARTIMRGKELAWDELRVLKGKEHSINHLLFEGLQQNKKALLRTAINYTDKIIPEERERLLFGEKTDIEVYTDENSDPAITQVHNDAAWNTVQSIRLAQLWIWDAHTQQFYMHLEATAPIQQVRDNEGQIMFDYPVFYIFYRPYLRH